MIGWKYEKCSFCILNVYVCLIFLGFINFLKVFDNGFFIVFNYMNNCGIILGKC